LLFDLEADDFFAFVAIPVSLSYAIKHDDFEVLLNYFQKLIQNKIQKIKISKFAELHSVYYCV